MASTSTSRKRQHESKSLDDKKTLVDCLVRAMTRPIEEYYPGYSRGVDYFIEVGDMGKIIPLFSNKSVVTMVESPEIKITPEERREIVHSIFLGFEDNDQYTSHELWMPEKVIEWISDSPALFKEVVEQNHIGKILRHLRYTPRILKSVLRIGLLSADEDQLKKFILIFPPTYFQTCFDEGEETSKRSKLLNQYDYSW